jgi:hypothetical protein
MRTYRNIGHHERVIRVGFGFLLLALSGFSLFPGWGDLAIMALGLIALFTGIIGYCPAWQLMGINTCHKHNVEHPAPHLQQTVHEHPDHTSHRT